MEDGWSEADAISSDEQNHLTMYGQRPLHSSYPYI